MTALDSENLMPIGRFAQACRLSVKALRHYDEIGLLSPARVDPRTGYRYYARPQARDAVFIGMLRSLGVPLGRIREILAADEAELVALIDAESWRVERELAERRQALVALKRIAGLKSLTPYEVTLRTEPDRPVVQLACAARADQLVVRTTRLIEDLLASLNEAGAQPREPLLTVNDPEDSDGNICVRACIGIEHRDRLPAGLRIEELNGGLCAGLEHIGPYEELGLAHHCLYAWAQENGHQPADSVRELYVNGPAENPPEELHTTVLLPITTETSPLHGS